MGEMYQKQLCMKAILSLYQQMDVVSSKARSGVPSELLYADDLVIMAPTMEQLGKRVADWRANLLGK